MMHRIRVSVLIAVTAITAGSCPAGQDRGQQQTPQDHIGWVAQVLTRMETIKPGMTRQDLLKVFRGEGGLSTGLQRTYVSRDCPFFKVDFEFEAVGRPSRDDEGRVTLIEDDRDIILKASRPYLEFTHAD